MRAVSILILYLCLNTSLLLLANNPLDSLQKLYEESPYDTVKIDAAHQLFKLTFRNNLSQAATFNEYAFHKSLALNYGKGIIESNYATGIVAYLKGEFQEAIAYFEQSIQQSIALGRDPTRFKVSIASVYQVTGDLDAAILIYEAAITHFEAQLDYKNSLVAANNLAVIYSNQGKYKQALKIYQKAFSHAENLQDSIKMSSLLINIGNSHYDIGDNTKAIDYLLKAINISAIIEDKRGQSVALNTIGEYYLEMKQAEKALAYLEKAGNIKLDLKYLPSYANTLLFESQAYQQLKNFKKAKEKIEAAIKIQVEVKDIRPLANAYFIFAEILIEDEDFDKGMSQLKKSESLALQTDSKDLLSAIYLKYAELINQGNLFAFDENKIDALSALDKAEIYLKDTDNLKTALAIYQAKAKWHTAKNEFRPALNYANLVQTIKDSLYTTAQVTALEEMRTKFEANQKEKENNLLVAKNELVNRKNQLYLSGLIALLFTAILLSYLYWKLNKTKKALAFEKQKVESQNRELAALNETKDRFFSIIAHDLRSPIASFQGIGAQINYFLKKQAFDRLTALGNAITQSSFQLNSLLDNLLNWSLSQTGQIPYRPKELLLKDILEEVISLFDSNLLTKKIQLTLDNFNTEKIYADERAISTIFRNLISNAIKFSEIGGQIHILVQQLNENQLKIAIKDEGQGMTPTQLKHIFKIEKESITGTKGEKGTGLGLILCKELLAINKGKIEVTSILGQGATFSVYLPIKASNV